MNSEPSSEYTQEETSMLSSQSPALPSIQRLGILGGGQLGRMSAQAAQKLGLKAHIYTPQPDGPASQVADETIVADWIDTDALRRFAESVDVVTWEFENIPLETVQILSQWVPVYPQPHVLEVSQSRWLEKQFLAQHGFPVVPFSLVSQPEQLDTVGKHLDYPVVLKTIHSGYDGKGQECAHNLVALRCAYAAFGNVPCVAERFLPLEREISVIGARDAAGRIELFPPFENSHRNHILDMTIVPARINDAMARQAKEIAARILEALDMRGLLCVEFFIDKTGQLLVNELAPRPHNSGHLTIEAAVSSQFEQHVRAVCGLELKNASSLRPSAMVNLLGDLWEQGEPNWDVLIGQPDLFLHLYGKKDAAKGRKMGHITALGRNTFEAGQKAHEAHESLLQASLV
jgi:5-(carboxyamino)imidazole ribonucleotide synthase